MVIDRKRNETHTHTVFAQLYFQIESWCLRCQNAYHYPINYPIIYYPMNNLVEVWSKNFKSSNPDLSRSARMAACIM